MASRLPSLSLNQAAFPRRLPCWDSPFDLGNPVDRLESRHVVFLEDHAALAKLRDCLLHVAGLPRHLRVISSSGPGGFEERELAITAPVTKPPRALPGGLKT
jgi:hypothetical protein